MKPGIPTPGGRIPLFTLALIGATQAVVWLIRSRKTRSRAKVGSKRRSIQRCQTGGQPLERLVVRSLGPALGIRQLA